MYDVPQLKETITITDGTVECPVRGCTTSVERARGKEPLRQPKFLCEPHGIYVSSSTFEYADEWDNLLWRDESDRQLMGAIKTTKRESRLARDNSEDALTWNVFRYLEKSGRLGSIVDAELENAQPAFWSFSQSVGGVVPALQRARAEFGEAGSEPDVIIEAPGRMIWIEAKLGSSNETLPSNPADNKKYLTGGDGWFGKAFVSEYGTVALDAKRYELMRLWLLGSWAAAQDGSEFFLINMTRQESPESSFASHIAKLANAHFVTASWEQFYRWLENQPRTTESDRLLKHLREKSAGYRNGRLEPAFATLGAG